MTIENRLARLERENKMMRFIGATGLLVVLVAVSTGAVLNQGTIVADTISAKAFLLYDADGSTVRGEWTVKDNITKLENNQVFENGTIRASFLCRQNGGGAIELLDSNDVVVGEFGLVEGASPTLTLKSPVNNQQKTRVRLRARDTAGMEVYSTSDTTQASISLTTQ